MKNRLENKIEGVGLKKTPMGVIMDLLDQQEERMNKIQDFIESKLKEWGSSQRCAKGSQCPKVGIKIHRATSRVSNLYPSFTCKVTDVTIPILFTHLGYRIILCFSVCLHCLRMDYVLLCDDVHNHSVDCLRKVKEHQSYQRFEHSCVKKMIQNQINYPVKNTLCSTFLQSYVLAK